MTDLEKEDIKKIAESDLNWQKLKNKRIMISGGTGFIGSLMLDVFRYRNFRYGDGIRVISLSRSGGTSDETVEYIKHDITKPVDYAYNIDYIIHLASNTHPKQYADDPIGTITTNIFGCNNLLKLAVEKKARFLLASSVEIYGQGSEVPMNEQYCGYIDCNQARSGYNEAKRTCESLCQSYRKKYGVNVVIARLARIFGADKKNDTKAMSQFIEKAVSREDIILKSQGNQRYSYCYVADAVSAIIKVLLDGIDGEAYNVSDEDEKKSLGEYAEYMAKLAGKKVIYQLENNPSVSKSTYALINTEKIKKLGWIPMYSVSEGLNKTYKIYKERTL